MIRNKLMLANYLIGMTLIIIAYTMGSRGVDELISLIILIPLYGVWVGIMSKRG